MEINQAIHLQATVADIGWSHDFWLRMGPSFTWKSDTHISQNIGVSPYV